MLALYFRCKVLILVRSFAQSIPLISVKEQRPGLWQGLSILNFNYSDLKVINRQPRCAFICESYQKSGLDKIFHRLEVESANEPNRD